ncbi:hypothetical protein DV737_g3104, partial [Chaetothyriales sp. CBS 132003]
MAPREDLVASAVTFLRDSSVSASPLDKRIEFLKSKNLTQEEIDLSLARAAEDPSLGPSVQASYAPVPAGRGPPTGLYANYPYNPYGQFQPPPPEPPRRDWRDWFIMATVIGGAGYGLWMLADRYIKPLVAPPTLPQLEQDKAAIDEQFNKAFTLLDTLASDTTALKDAEEQRTKRLDAAIADIEAIVSELQAATQRRQDDARRMEAEINAMKDSLPRSIDNVRDASERQLKELSTELSSLKLLMSNRLAGSPSPMAAIPKTQPADISSMSAQPAAVSAGASSEAVPGSSSSNISSSANPTGINGVAKAPAFPAPVSSTAVLTPRLASSTPLGGSGSKASIPAWQMAAQKAQKDGAYNIASAPTVNNTHSQPSSISSPNNDGADAVAALTAA